jgi:hypothetical protein
MRQANIQQLLLSDVFAKKRVPTETTELQRGAMFSMLLCFYATCLCMHVCIFCI